MVLEGDIVTAPAEGGGGAWGEGDTAPGAAFAKGTAGAPVGPAGVM